jgi:hypothetical protein
MNGFGEGMTDMAGNGGGLGERDDATLLANLRSPDIWHK